jgi:hypothetical protein
MRPPRTARGVSARLLVVVSGLLLVLPLGASQAQSQRATVPGKTFAAYEYGWYPISLVDHFDGPLPDHWAVDGTDDGGTVGTQHGMFTIDSGRSGGTGATLTGNDHATGRWEIRLRARRFERGHVDYTVTAKLVPDGDQSRWPATGRPGGARASTTAPCRATTSPP